MVALRYQKILGRPSFLLGLTCFFSSQNGFDLVGLAFTGFLLLRTGFYRVLLRIYRVFSGCLLNPIWLDLFELDFTGLNPIEPRLVGFTEFYWILLGHTIC